MGRTGILTPVAHITPTSLSGVTISRISLHNPDFITSKDIQQGDQVWIQRSGEVIPYIVSVATQHRTGREKPVNLTHIQCPACQKYAQLTTNQVGTKNDPNITTQLFCTNPDCHGILKEKLKHFISKQAMNIISLGDSTIDLLVDQ